MITIYGIYDKIKLSNNIKYHSERGETMMNMPAIIATIIMLIGFTVVLIVPIIKLKRLDEETNGYKKVMGKVVDYIKKGYTSSNESRKVYYYPVVLYEVDNK